MNDIYKILEALGKRKATIDDIRENANGVTAEGHRVLAEQSEGLRFAAELIAAHYPFSLVKFTEQKNGAL